MPRSASPLSVGLTAAAALATALAILVASGSMEIVDLVVPGQAGFGGDLMVRDFGETSVGAGYSYDGQSVYLAARALPDLDAAVEAVAGPEFRLRRVLLPLLSSPGGTGNTIIVLMTAWNIVGIFLASWGLADIAARHGRDARLGYAAMVALAFPVVIGTTEPLAFGLGLAGVALVGRDRLWWGGAALALAGLARETALVMALAVVIDLLLERRLRASAALLVGSFAPFLVWNQILQSRVTSPPAYSTDLFGFLDLPALGWLDFALSGATLLLMFAAVLTWRDARSVALIALGYLGCCAFYIGDQYRWHGLVRVSAVGVALGLAGIASQIRREPAPAPVARTS